MYSQPSRVPIKHAPPLPVAAPPEVVEGPRPRWLLEIPPDRLGAFALGCGCVILPWVFTTAAQWWYQ